MERMHMIHLHAVRVVMCWFLVTTGCGRTNTGPFGQVPPDSGPIADTIPQPCQATCQEVCNLLDSCGLMNGFSGVDPMAFCLNRCQSQPTEPMVRCSKRLACAPATGRCEAVTNCLFTADFPDLRVSHRAESGAAGRLDFNVEVCNQGLRASGTFEVRYFIDGASAPDSSSPSAGVLEMDSIEPGACLPQVTSMRGLPEGLYRTWVLADGADRVIEAHETNNVSGPVDVRVLGGGDARPDLTLSNLRVEVIPGSPNARFAVTVCNQGHTFSTNTQIGMYRNRNALPVVGARADVYVTLPGMAPGRCAGHAAVVPLVPGITQRCWAFADPSDLVGESNEGNNLAGPVDVSVPPIGQLPDLVVTSLNVFAAPDGNAKFFLTVCNQGNQLAPQATVDLYLDRPSRPSASDAGAIVFGFGSLRPNECTSQNATSWLWPGTYRAWAYVDRDGRVQESNESNNVYGPSSYTVASASLPDLRIRQVQTATTGNGAFQISATICNDGTGFAGATDASATLSPELTGYPPTPAPVVSTVAVPELNPGQCATQDFVIYVKAGVYRLSVEVDPNNRITESNESNNRYGPIQVVVSTYSIDLTISGFVARTSPMGDVAYDVTVCNVGTRNAPVTSVYLYYNRFSEPTTSSSSPDDRIPLIALSAGACTTVTFRAVLAAGTYRSWVLVDPNNGIPEQNEANNAKGPLSVFVPVLPQPDLMVSSFTAGATPTGDVTYAVEVCNRGNAPSRASDVGIYFNRSAPPSSPPADRTLAVNALDPGQCYAQKYQTQLKPGTYTSYALADVFQIINESNESNNSSAAATFAVVPPDPCRVICQTLISPCGFFGQDQLASCQSNCKAQPADRIACAEKASAVKSCGQVVTCLLGF